MSRCDRCYTKVTILLPSQTHQTQTHPVILSVSSYMRLLFVCGGRNFFITAPSLTHANDALKAVEPATEIWFRQ